MGRKLRNFSSLFAIAKFGESSLVSLVLVLSEDLQVSPQKCGILGGMFKLSHLSLARLVWGNNRSLKCHGILRKRFARRLSTFASRVAF